MAPPLTSRSLPWFPDSPAALRPLFAVVVKEPVLVEHKLKIPTKSGIIFGEDLLELGTLTVPNSNRVWQVRIEKNEKMIYMCLKNGVNDFIKHYSIHSKSILQFTYQGNSSFFVRICDALGAEIDYPLDHDDHDCNDDGLENTPIVVDYGSCRRKGLSSSQIIKPRKRGSSSRIILSSDHSDSSEFYWHQTRNVSHIKQEKDDENKNQIDDDDDDDDVHVHVSTPIMEGGFSETRSGQIKPRKRGRRSKIISKDQSNSGEFYWYQTRNVSRIKKEREEDDQNMNQNHDNNVLVNTVRKPKKRGRRIVASKGNTQRFCSKTSYLKEEEEEEEFKHEMIIPKSFSYINGRKPVMSEASKKAAQAAQASKPRNPSFLLLLKSTLCNMDVPAEFVRKYMRFSPEKIELQPGNEKKKWPVRCYYADKDRSFVKRLGKGWSSFSWSQRLKKGDICVFEMVRCVNGVVFRVWIYRSASFDVKDTHSRKLRY